MQKYLLNLNVFGFTEVSTGFQVARHSLSYIQEIGNGWFGQVTFVFYFFSKYTF